MVSAVVVILPESLQLRAVIPACKPTGEAGAQMRYQGISNHIRHFFGPQMNEETQQLPTSTGIFLKTLPKEFPPDI